jgi:hypothetical protein
MRIFIFSILVSIAAFVTAARADECVNTAVNNPAFSSTYAAGAQPCPPPVAKPPKSTLSTKPSTPPVGPKTKTAAAKPVIDPDRPAITNTPNGTLLKSGDTTVCISGSVSVVMAAGSGHRPSEPKLHDSNEPGCN